MILGKYNEVLFILPCVVDFINYENQFVIDVIQHRDQLFSKGDEIEYLNYKGNIEKKLKDYPVQTELKMTDRLSFRRVRYFCIKTK